jgi:arylsulfatase A-like enzyme
MENDRKVEVSPTDFYFTDAITDKAIGMIEESVRDDKPFFLYLAHAAPHWPLHAPAESIARYDGAYAGAGTRCAVRATSKCAHAGSCNTIGRSHHAIRTFPPGRTRVRHPATPWPV